jgi:sugar O-acyltransferase (sialic acid O-acetyltransferase NeuD family)
MDSLIVYGCGGFGREVKSMISLPYIFEGYVDDNKKTKLGDGDWLLNQESKNVVIAVGDGKIRKGIYTQLSKANHEYPSIIHKSVIIQDGKTVQIERGCIIGAGCIFTTEIQVGSFSVINLNCTIGHDAKFGAFVSIMPSVNIGGGVTIEDEVYIGSGATVLPYLRIGKGATVGAGAVVTKDVPPGTTVIGIPAKQI